MNGALKKKTNMTSEAIRNINKQLQQKFGIIGDSSPIQDAFAMLLQAAPTELSVLITGPTGVGKEVFANALHGLSRRKNNQFVSVNCGAIPETLLESELFGHEKGAFTGAYEQRKGFFEYAHRGTLFLDEIGEIPQSTQVKLLRVLESGEFSRLGSSVVNRVDVRIVAATNRDLEQEVNKGAFREDLFFRLKNVHIYIPPLRMHKEDIPTLVDFFATKTAKKIDLEFRGFSPEALSFMQSLPWNGNIRELKNLIDTIIMMENKNYITDDIVRRYIAPALPPYKGEDTPPDNALVKIPQPEAVKDIEMKIIFRTLLEIQSGLSDIRRDMNKIMDDLQELKDSSVKSEEVYPWVEEVLHEDENYKEDINLSLIDMERRLISEALRKHKGKRREAAYELGISERTLYRKISEFGLDK
jgi:DNA-binding NtrC family response regulator